MHYSDFEQRQMDIKSGEELDRRARVRKCPHCGSDKVVINHYRLGGMPPAVFACEGCGCSGEWTLRDER